MASVSVADPRRITEADPDFLRVRAQWERRLLASVRQMQREIAAGGEHAIASAQSAFIHRHIALLRDTYVAGHSEGQRDYWDEVSLTPAKWTRERHVTPAHALIQRRLLFYASASVVKLAREVATLWRQTHPTHAGRTFADLPDDLAWDKFTAWASPRIGLQADISWSGFQDGYLDAATADSAGLRLQLWWELEPSAKHCDDCPAYAASSPYDAPGSGGNELDATPGDGHTACGANCKCDLRYGWTDLRGVGATPGENELVIPSDQTPAVSVAAPGWPEREAAIERALQSQQGGTSATAWLERDEAIARVGGVYGRPRPLPGFAPGQVDTTRVETAGGDVSLTRDMVRVTQESEGVEPQALAALNDGQKQALDQIRGIALLWDAIRGQLPNFETYFDPASQRNLWQNRDLAGLDSAQRELVARYFRALGDWQDATPIDEE